MTTIALLVWLLAAAVTPPPVAPGDGCGCDFARLNNAWCRACQIGYVAGVPIRSQNLFEALDAHGHECDPAAIRCPTCCEAIENGGFCEPHRVGFHEGRLYATRLTWALARGMPFAVDELTCDTCRAKALRIIAAAAWDAPQDARKPLDGWCEECEVGMVGNVAFCSRAAYEAAIKEFRRLAQVVETSKRCERCAGAQLFGTHCSICSIRYDLEGHAISTGPSQPAGSAGR